FLLKYPTKLSLVRALLDRVDAAALGSLKGVDASDTARDRLFGLVMRRFDVLQENRPAAAALLKGLRCDPVTALCLVPRVNRSAAATLAAAGVATGGLR